MATRVPPLGGEKESLHAALTRHREVVQWKVAGLTDDDLRRPFVPSGTSLLGLVKHLGAVEYGWFCTTFDRATEPLPFVEDDPEADMSARKDETTEEILAFYDRSITAADAVVDELDLDAIGRAWYGDNVSLRWVLLHMVEETARHAGHIDIGRELIDGLTGDHQRE